MKNEIRHPNVVRIYDFVDAPSDLFIIMEYATKGELYNHIANRGTLSESESKTLFIQLISALDYFHQKGISHRDLKLENLLIDSDGNLKICDFGLCNIMNDGAQLNTSCGSPNYAAPEIIKAEPYDGKQIDIWSCGIVLYAMVFGGLPFEADQITKLFELIKDAKYEMPRNSALSRDIFDLINKLLQPNPLRRISIPEIWEHPWVSCLPPKYNHPSKMKLDNRILK